MVAVPNGGDAEYLQDSHNCLLYESGNEDQGIACIERICNNENLREQLLSGAKETVAKRDWSSIRAEILAL